MSDRELIDRCLTALTSVLGENRQELIPLHVPCFEGREWEYVKDCLDSGWVSSVGEYVSLFEKKLVEYTELPYAVAVVNGTSALHISLLLAEVRSNDEVLVPSLTFVATVNAISYCAAVPHFVDATPINLGIDIPKLTEYLKENTFVKNKTCFNKQTGRRIKAIIPVHIFGHPVEMHALNELCIKYHITVIEDATESLGSLYDGKHTGYFSEISVLSFNGNKIITTGGGGAILLKTAELAKKAKHLSTTAKIAHGWEFFHDEIGYNYRLPNINAALGCAQLEQLGQFVEQKRSLAKKYINAFECVEGVKILKEPAFAKSNYWLNALILDKPDRNFVENFIDAAYQSKYGLRGLWTPINRLPMYVDCPKMDLSNTDSLFDRVISLPSSSHLDRNLIGKNSHVTG